MVDAFAAAIAVARAAQAPGGRDEARRLLAAYVDEGLDEARLAFAACQLLALADETVGRLSGQASGSWLEPTARRVALRAVAPGPADAGSG